MAAHAKAKVRIVLKLGGELLEQPHDLEQIARGIAALAQRASLVVVHGGGREIDSALASAGIPKQQVDGLRVTDARTLDVVVAVLAGAINTRLVAALRKAGARPVGLTGADAAVATMKRSTPMATVAGCTSTDTTGRPAAPCSASSSAVHASAHTSAAPAVGRGFRASRRSA